MTEQQGKGNGGDEMTSSECIPSDILALMIDGKASRRERNRWLPHLDSCHDCRTVLASAVSYIEEIEGDVASATLRWVERWFRSPVLVPALGIVLLVVGFSTWRPESPMSTQAVQALYTSSPASHGDNLWVRTPSGRGFSGDDPTDPSQRAFRTGVYLVHVRVSIRESRHDELSRVTQELVAVNGASPWLDALSDRAAANASREELEAAVDDVEASCSGMSAERLALGMWTASARLAALATDTSYFESDTFTEPFARFRASELPPPIAGNLADLDALLPRAGEAANLVAVARTLQNLMLLN